MNSYTKVRGSHRKNHLSGRDLSARHFCIACLILMLSLARHLATIDSIDRQTYDTDCDVIFNII